MSEKFSSRREETNAVKRALREAGVPFKSVTHGRGTAWGWLEINIGEVQNSKGIRLSGKCQRRIKKATRIAQKVTGREGKYNGRICVLAQ